MDLVVIGGTGVYDPAIFEESREQVVRTPYGPARVRSGQAFGRSVGFIPRHGQGHSLPPHRINYRANIWATRELGARRVVSTSAVGSCREAMAPGDLVFIDQFIDWTSGARPKTFFDGGDERGVVHTDFTEPYCPELRRLLADEAGRAGYRHHQGGVYVCTEGPRFETPAEIRAVRALGGDLVGMTQVPEVVLARELGLCYASIALVTNYAAGMSGGRLTHEEVLAVMAEHGSKVRRLVSSLIERLPETRRCAC